MGQLGLLLSVFPLSSSACPGVRLSGHEYIQAKIFFFVPYPCLPMVNVTSLQNFSSTTQCLPSVPALAWSHTWCSLLLIRTSLSFLSVSPHPSLTVQVIGHSHSAGFSWHHKPATPWFSWVVEWMWGFKKGKRKILWPLGESRSRQELCSPSGSWVWQVGCFLEKDVKFFSKTRLLSRFQAVYLCGIFL